MTFQAVCDRPIVWLDTETTGLDPLENDIIEFAAVRDDTGESLEMKIWPDRPENANPRALEINGYSVEAWEEAGAVTMEEAAPKIAAFLHNVILGGQNVSFDEDFIKAALKTHKVETRIGYHKLDTVTLALVHIRPLGIRSVSLHTICNVLGISNEGEHTAMADVLRTQAVYQALRNPSKKDIDAWTRRISGINAARDAKK